MIIFYVTWKTRILNLSTVCDSGVGRTDVCEKIFLLLDDPTYCFASCTHWKIVCRIYTEDIHSSMLLWCLCGSINISDTEFCNGKLTNHHWWSVVSLTSVLWQKQPYYKGTKGSESHNQYIHFYFLVGWKERMPVYVHFVGTKIIIIIWYDWFFVRTYVYIVENSDSIFFL